MDDLTINPLHAQRGLGNESFFGLLNHHTKLDPDLLVRAIGGAAFERLLSPPPEPTQPIKPPERRKLPPYGARIDPASKGEIGIFTGSQAWEWVDSLRFRFRSELVLLPFREVPTFFKWPVASRDCVVLGFGEPEPRESLFLLSIELVKAGASVVYWRGQFVRDEEGEPRLLDTDLSSPFSPVFRPNVGVIS